MAHRAASPAEAAKGAITRDESNATARPRPALPSQHQSVAAAGGVIAGGWSGVATVAPDAEGGAGNESPAPSPRGFCRRQRGAWLPAAVGRSPGLWHRGGDRRALWWGKEVVRALDLGGLLLRKK